MRAMLDALLVLTETGAFEDNGGLRLRSATQTERELVLEILLTPGDESADQLWRIECTGVQDFRLCSEFVDQIAVVADHQVLWPFTEPVVALHFYGPAGDPLRTVGALYERHRQIAQDWIPFHRYLNPFPDGLSALLNSSSGELASGPACLIAAYVEVLTEHDVRSSRLPPDDPKIWDGQRWVAPPVLRALIFEDSFVVAEAFSASQRNV